MKTVEGDITLNYLTKKRHFSQFAVHLKKCGKIQKEEMVFQENLLRGGSKRAITTARM